MSMEAPPLSSTAQPVAPKSRHRWMDTLRGGAIVLVVCWHSAGILALFEHDVPTWLVAVNELFASYRMPTLMFLSGMLLNASLRKRLPVYYSGKARRILWPFLLWNAIHWLVFFAPQYGLPIWSKLLWTTSYLWFLLYILSYYLLAPLLKRVPAWVLVVVPFVASEFFADSTNNRRFLFLAGFFFLGRLVSENRALFDRVLASRWLWLLVPPVLAFSIAFATLGPWRYHGALAVFSVAGILLAIKLAQLVSVGAATRAIEFIGRNSIVFYVSHFPTIVGVIFLSSLVSLPTAVVIPLSFAVAMLVGTALAHLSSAPPASWLFVAPQLGRRRAAAVAV